jgi:hypothetical protein
MSMTVYAAQNRSRRYGLHRRGQWLMPPADTSAGFTDDPAAAWVVFSVDEAMRRQMLLLQTGGPATLIRALP